MNAHENAWGRGCSSPLEQEAAEYAQWELDRQRQAWADSAAVEADTPLVDEEDDEAAR